MENELMTTEGKVYEAALFTVEPHRGNYIIASPLMCGKSVELKRSGKTTDKNGKEIDACDKDFGIVGNAKKPSLLKAGAEKIANACGMLQHYEIVSKIEDAAEPFFFYLVRCDLCKVDAATGKEYVFYSSFGSANTKEKRNGMNGAFDSANNCLKMSVKRSLVGAVLSMGGISDMFTQDMEDTAFIDKNYREIANTQDPNAPVTAAQIKRLYAIANDNGYNAKEAKKILAENGVTDTKAIKQGEYDKVCDLFKKE